MYLHPVTYLNNFYRSVLKFKLKSNLEKIIYIQGSILVLVLIKG